MKNSGASSFCRSEAVLDPTWVRAPSPPPPPRPIAASALETVVMAGTDLPTSELGAASATPKKPTRSKAPSAVNLRMVHSPPRGSVCVCCRPLPSRSALLGDRLDVSHSPARAELGVSGAHPPHADL